MGSVNTGRSFKGMKANCTSKYCGLSQLRVASTMTRTKSVPLPIGILISDARGDVKEKDSLIEGASVESSTLAAVKAQCNELHVSGAWFVFVGRGDSRTALISDWEGTDQLSSGNTMG